MKYECRVTVQTLILKAKVTFKVGITWSKFLIFTEQPGVFMSDFAVTFFDSCLHIQAFLAEDDISILN